jgi:rhodanese-related sulfurtransferase
MQTISRDELKTKLDRGDPIRLVMTLGRGLFQLKHIPGSLQFDHYRDAMQVLGRDEEIVLYCTGGHCTASRTASEVLTSHGYTHIRHYPGGLIDWEEAGLPLEGALARQ